MALLSIEHIQIAGLTATVPVAVESNFKLPHLNEEQKKMLVTTTGIENRRIANTNTTAADLCIHAAEKILTACKWTRSEVDVLVFISQTPDYTIPGSSMYIQQKLGLPNTCLAIDVNQGCAGYVYGLSVIASLMSAGKLKKGLLLVGDTLTKTIANNDEALVPIFSDAGSCTLLEYSAEAKPMFFNLQTDGAGYDKIIVKGGGARVPAHAGNGNLYMNGQDIFNFGLKQVAANVEVLFSEFGLNKTEIDYFVMHQANMLLNETIRKKLGIDAPSTLYSLKEYGNTSCATIPVTMAAHAALLNAQPNRNLLLAGFGVGLSWGAAMVHIHQINCLGVNEYDA